MKTSKQKLTEALEFQKDMLRFYAKNYPIYINELEKYAELNGYKDFETMIKELSND